MGLLSNGCGVARGREGERMRERGMKRREGRRERKGEKGI